MANVLRLWQRGAGDPADSNQEPRAGNGYQTIDERATGSDFLLGRAAVGQRLARDVRVGGDGIPEDNATFGPKLFEDAVNDRAGRLFPGPRPAARSAIGITPPKQIELAGERDPRPAHALVASGLADGDNVSRGSLIQVMPQIRQSDRGGIRQVVGPEVPELVEGGADRCLRQVLEQGVDRALVTIGQWS